MRVCVYDAGAGMCACVCDGGAGVCVHVCVCVMLEQGCVCVVRQVCVCARACEMLEQE